MPEPTPTPWIVSRRELLTTALAFAALALVFMLPLFRAPSNWCIEDWDQHAFYAEAPRVSILQYHQVPLWNPWACGGTDLLANPQNRALAPTFVIDLALGAVRGLKVEYWLHALLGMLGLYMLARQLGLSRIAAWLPPCATFLSSLYALPVSTGMSWVTSLGYMPWAVLAFMRAFERRELAVLAGACVALMNLAGGAYTSVVTYTFMGVFALAAVPRTGARRSVETTSIAVVSSVALGAMKLFPALAFMRENPRHMGLLSGLSVDSLLVGLFSLDQRLQVAYTHFDGPHFDPDLDGPHFSALHGIATEFDDVGMYIGLLGGALLLVGLVVSLRRAWRLGALLALFAWLSLGDRLRFNPIHLLHHLPVYESMRYAERYRFIWFPCAMFFAAFGLDWIAARLDARFTSRRPGALVAGALLGIELLDFHRVVAPIYAAACPIVPPPLPAPAAFHQITALPDYGPHGPLAADAKGFEVIYGSFSAQLPALLENEGTVDCYETAWVPRKALASSSPDYKGEAWLKGTSGKVTNTEWTPNRLRYDVHATGDGLLVVNQNHYRSWRTRDGRPVLDEAGLLAVPVTPQDRTIELDYRPTSFFVGAVVSALAWLALGAALIARMRKRAPVRA